MIPNAPPVATHGMHIDDLWDEAKGFLDGNPISTPEEAQGVAKLLDALRTARKAADEQRKLEKAPHDLAGKAVQEAWNPLLVKCDLATGTCKDVLTPWQRKLDDEQRALADAAAEEAEKLRIAALEAARGAAQSGDLSARADADDALKAAESASKTASRLDRAKPQVAGGSRAVGLRTSYGAEITDILAFSRWAWANRRTDYEAFLNDLAEREGRRGPVEIPGLTVHTIRKSA